MRGTKKIIAVLLSLLLFLSFPPMGTDLVKAATVVTNNIEGRDGEYTYSLWKDYGDTTMTVKGNGQFECEWKNIGNALFREGIKFDCTKTYKQMGAISVEYGVDYKPDGNSYLCVYGWSRDPLIEYYIVDSWGTWRPPGSKSMGTIEVDGGTYDIYETIRENQPSIDGNTTFKQYWSVRTEKRTSGTISVTEHFKAWEQLGLTLGKLYEASLTVEGYQSNGWADVYSNKVTVNGENSNNTGNNNVSKDSSSKTTGNETKFECESMEKSGPYAGNTYSPFSGAALYANTDSVETTIDFSSATNDFTLRGASDGSNTARVDLVIGNKTVGTFSFKGTEPTEQTIKNISTGTGNQKVKLTVTADDGTWDVFLDNFTIKESKVSGNSSKPAKPVISALASNDGSITISIGKTEGVSGYRIYVKEPGSNKYVKLKTVKKNGTKVRTYTFTPANAGKYSFKVKAYNKSGNKKKWSSASKAVKVNIQK